MKKYIINTTLDKNYIHFGCALIDSLDRHYATDLQRKFEYNVYCLDRTSFRQIAVAKNKRFPNVPMRVNSVDDFKRAGDYEKLVNKPPSFEALNVAAQKEMNANYMELLWSIASFSTHHLMNTRNDIDGVVYIDADCYFLNDWTKVFPTLEKRSIGLVRNNAGNNNNGEYNVSFIFFKNDLIGNRALQSWRDWILNPNNQYAKEYGTCADQKYLDLFPELFGKENICVLDDNGFVQTAPWSIYPAGAKIKLKIKDTLFHHFSDFRPDYENNIYRIAPRHGWNDEYYNNKEKELGINILKDGFKQTEVKKLYDEYFERTRHYYVGFGNLNKKEK